MTKTISVKDLRLHFADIRKDLEKGVHFVVIYRSQPIGKLTPLRKNGSNADRKKFFQNWPILKLPKGTKKFNAVEIIRKDRGY